MINEYPHRIGFSDSGKKTFERIAALMDFDDWNAAIGPSGDLTLNCAKEYVKGKTGVICVTPELEELYENNPEFFNALCEDGVVEWLTPLVLAKSTTLHPPSP